MAKTKIGRFTAAIIIQALRFAERKLISRIKDDEIKIDLSKLFNVLIGFVAALSDDNERDGEQLKTIFRKFVYDDVGPRATQELAQLVGKIKNENVRDFFIHFVLRTDNVVKIYSDDDKDNERQIVELFNEFIKDPTTAEIVLHTLLEPALERFLGQEEVDFILALIAQVISDQQNKLGNKMLLAKLPNRGGLIKFDS